MKIGYLGTGSWGFCLSSLLASKGYEVTAWTTKETIVEAVQKTGHHPQFPKVTCPENLKITTDLKKTIQDADCLVESVTANGLRPVCLELEKLSLKPIPFIITSKGIEQDSSLLLPEVVVDTLGQEFYEKVGCISGPGYAQEVIFGLPTSVVSTAYHYETMMFINALFTSPTFRVYPNSDIKGVSFGGALKNVIAIACGISDGLKFGSSSRAALITRGLHEIRKLAMASGATGETLNGLAGMGDLCLTCSSPLSRNFLFGTYLAEGIPMPEALKKVGTVVEGAYTSVTALQLSRKLEIPMPITETVYQILHEGLKPQDAVALLMQREVKEEHL